MHELQFLFAGQDSSDNQLPSWHAHPGAELLYILHGECIFHQKHSPRLHAGKGMAIIIPPATIAL